MTTSDRSRSKQVYNMAAKHSRFPMTTKYVSRSSVTSIEFEVAAVTIASLKSLSSFDNAIDVSHREFF